MSVRGYKGQGLLFFYRDHSGVIKIPQRIEVKSGQKVDSDRKLLFHVLKYALCWQILEVSNTLCMIDIDKSPSQNSEKRNA